MYGSRPRWVNPLNPCNVPVMPLELLEGQAEALLWPEQQQQRFSNGY